MLKQCWFLAGPTASGKTAVSLHVARELNAEIIALDSMTLYRGMDIGTAKPTLDEQAKVPHHLIDIIDPHEEFSLADYLAAARICCQQILDRGKTPLFVGGTGLYLRGILRGVFEGPSADWTIRKELENRAAQFGHETLHQDLKQVDPITAARLHPKDLRRVIRAIEVFRLTGSPLSQYQTHSPRVDADRPSHVYWLEPDRQWLYQRIDARVDQMFVQGLLDEVRRLMNLPNPISRTARQALGYKEILDAIELTSTDQLEPATQSFQATADLISLIQTRTRQFAKRQMTWFRNLEECTPIPIDGTESTEILSNRLLITLSQN